MNSPASVRVTPEESSFLRTINEIAARSPEAIALAAPAREDLTYRGLAGRLDELTRRLHRLGIYRGRRLALLLPAGPDAVVASFAVMSSATALPLNPGLRAGELESKLRQLRADGVLAGADAGAEALAAAESCGLPVFRLRVEPGSTAGEFVIDGEPLPADGGDQSGLPPAVVLQTSGTTGRPKNVPLSHANLLASSAGIRASMSLSDGDRFLCAAQPHRIVGVALTLASLEAGSATFCAPYYGAAFLDWVESFRPTWFWLTPTMLRELIPLARQRRAAFRNNSLRFIRCGSAVLPPALLAEAEELFGVPVVENYGMTEAGNQIACNPVSADRRRPGSAGVPAGPQVRIEEGSGEILVRGPSVFAGYEDDQEANRTAFCDGWFRTGDVGRFDADGFLYVTGRIKELINRGGEKIAPREVEDALAKHPAVAEAAVFAIPHPRLGEDVGAAVVLRAGALATTSELRETVVRRLAAFKAPARVWVLPEIPKGPGGKIQRIGLAEKLGLGGGPAAPARRGPKVSPATPLEEQLAAIWRSVLKSDEVGVDDDFYDLGGDSFALNLLLTEVQARYKAGNRLVDRIAFLEVPTIATQARLIGAGTAGACAGRPVPDVLVPARTSGRQPPLFFVQSAGEGPAEALHLARALDADRPVYGYGDSVPACRRGIYTIEDVAEKLLTAIRAVQPRGPYHLAGHCFGGVVVFETARRLAQSGEEVGLLVLIDTPASNYPRLTAHARLYGKELARWCRCRFRGRDAAGLRGLAADAVVLGRHLKRQALAPLTRGLHRVRSARESLGLDNAYDANVRAQRAYLPKPYAGAVVHILSRGYPRSGSLLDRRFGWKEVVSGPEERLWVDADHESMLLPPSVTEVARHLRRLLDRPE